MVQAINWPQKTQELHNHHFDSTIWNNFQFRHDDIIIATYAKSGTTWMQQIVAQMMFGGNPELAVAEMSPWLDLRVPPKAIKLPMVEGQTHRRFIKTHLPVDALVYSPEAKYLYIGRDGHPFWPFWENIRSWWQIRELPNLMLVHFTNLKRDMPGQMRSIAAFLDMPIDETRWDAIVEYCSFDWMKQNATKSVPSGGAFWDAGAEVFINKGVNGRWADTLTAAEAAAYEAHAVQELGSECAHWLATGEGLDESF